MRRSSGLRLGRLEVLHEIERHAHDVPDAERHGPHVHVGVSAVEQVGDHPRLARREHFLGDLLAGREGAAGQGLLPPAARELELELAAGLGEHDEGALGARHFQRGIEHELEHVLQHASGAERPEPFEQRRHLTQVVARARRRSPREALRRVIGAHQDQIGPATTAQAYLVAGLERAVGHRLAIDERAVA